MSDLAIKDHMPENVKALEAKIKNNEKLIESLKRDSLIAENRKNTLNEGLESKAIDIKFALEGRLANLKNELKILKL